MKGWKFGVYERIIGTGVLLIMWAMLVLVSNGMVAEHGSDAERFEDVMRLANFAMLAAITSMFWLRPILSELPRAVKKAKEVVA